MTPETNIIQSITGLWVEKFPEGNTDGFPKGVVKRISSPLLQEKDRSIPRQFNSRLRIIWYDQNTIGFDAKMESILSEMEGLTTDEKIKNVVFDTREDGYDPLTDKHVMRIDFMIKHYT